MARVNVSPARWAAFEILRKVEDGAFSSVLLAEQDHLSDTDRALCHELVLGVLRWQLLLDELIKHYSDRKLSNLDGSVLLALRLGLYQLRFLNRIPASAAVNESVKLAQAARVSSARAFVNAVLRRATRESDYDPTLHVSDPITRLSIESSHPAWLIERWVDSFGFEEAQAFARANNETPVTAFRVVRHRTDDADVQGRLLSAGIESEPSKIVSGAWRVSRSAKILREMAATGDIYFQDEASQLVAHIVEPHAGDRVLDLCSAPGGKSTLIADHCASARVVAADISAKRLATVVNNAALQNLTNISVMRVDANEELPFSNNEFDRMLVDAPCSGTGTLRHNPEVRWRITEDDVKRLASQQVRFLVNAAKALKRSGRLVYSTCSVEREENEGVVAKFLELERNFKMLRVEHGSVSPTTTGALRTWPHRDNTDGFFVAALTKY